MLDWIVLLAVVSAFSAMGFIVVAVLWLRRLRESVSAALAEAARQQIHTAQHLGETIAQVQKQQRSYGEQIQNLSQANLQLKQGLFTVASRLDIARAEAMRGDQTMH